MQQLYYLAFHITPMRTVYKIGITRNSIKTRYNYCATPYTQVWSIGIADIEDLRMVEKYVTRKYANARCQDAPVHGLGNRELFVVDVLPRVEDALLLCGVLEVDAEALELDYNPREHEPRVYPLQPGDPGYIPWKHLEEMEVIGLICGRPYSEIAPYVEERIRARMDASSVARSTCGRKSQ